MTATCSSTTSPSVADTPNSGRLCTTPIHVVDVGSLTRTDVNKAPVALRCLAHGDEVQIGKLRRVLETTAPHP
jgi:hypothetical protein